MSYSLKRERDGAGDSGSMSDLYILDKYEKGLFEEIKHDARPEVGGFIVVGSPFGRSYANQDWWQTTLITEILVDEENYMKFRTGNSIYEWKQL